MTSSYFHAPFLQQHSVTLFSPIGLATLCMFRPFPHFSINWIAKSRQALQSIIWNICKSQFQQDFHITSCEENGTALTFFFEPGPTMQSTNFMCNECQCDFTWQMLPDVQILCLSFCARHSKCSGHETLLTAVSTDVKHSNSSLVDWAQAGLTTSSRSCPPPVHFARTIVSNLLFEKKSTHAKNLSISMCHLTQLSTIGIVPFSYVGHLIANLICHRLQRISKPVEKIYSHLIGHWYCPIQGIQNGWNCAAIA